MYLFSYCIYIVFMSYLKAIIVFIVFIMQSYWKFKFSVDNCLFIQVFIQTIFTHELF